ncbi:MAG: ATP-binding cassette domain-containing protein [Deltaproteobacteria bacterium]|jgi:putative ABC transport system ATP-binding protein|nr:ATP-binding cassette domain-containing protein [Deltaproteobacteria bacterium]
MLRLEGLSKWFAKGTVNEVQALDGLDLEVGTGEFVCVIGSNGAGKSTLLNCVAGTYPPDKGRILLAGEDIGGRPEFKRARLIGRVFQDPLLGTCASMTIEENMALANRRGKRRTLRPGIRDLERERFREALSKLGLGLEDRLKDKAGLLSGGQRQALTLLMATLVRPTILLLDEHTAALDPKTAGLIMDLTRDLVEGGKLTTIMITHNMQQALSFGGRLVMMHRGKVLLDYSGSEKERLTVQDLLRHFHEANPLIPDNGVTDRMVLG